LVVERLRSGNYYVTSPKIAGLGLVAHDLKEAAEDLPWVVERLVWLQDHVSVSAGSAGIEPLAAALSGRSPELELVPTEIPPQDSLS
jgi:hypothetical protein